MEEWGLEGTCVTNMQEKKRKRKRIKNNGKVEETNKKKGKDTTRRERARERDGYWRILFFWDCRTELRSPL